MKSRSLFPGFLGLCLVVLSLCSPVLGDWLDDQDNMQTWTGKNGKQVEAEFLALSRDGTRVRLRTPAGRIVETAVAGFIDSDQERIRFAHAAALEKRALRIRGDYLAGQAFYFGGGVEQDYTRAVKHYERAAKGGDVDAAFALGVCYALGHGVKRDWRRARAFFEEAANAGHEEAQYNFGYVLSQGLGGDKDPIGAIRWLEKSANSGSYKALHQLGDISLELEENTLAADYYSRAGEAALQQGDRAAVLENVTSLRRMHALALSDRLHNRLLSTPESRPDPSTPRAAPGSGQQKSSGTGWFCSPRHVVTCWHVLHGHSRFSLVRGTKDREALRLVAADRQNDLALLELAGKDGVSGQACLPLSTSLAAAGEDVFTIGYPHVDLLGKAAKYTEGTISSTYGMDDDPRVLQVSVPVQSGNSGGPLLDKQGCVVAIVTSKLAVTKVFEWTGDLPQNVNYAVKSVYLRTLLDMNQIKYSSKPSWAQGISQPDLVREVQRAVVRIEAE